MMRSARRYGRCAARVKARCSPQRRHRPLSGVVGLPAGAVTRRVARPARQNRIPGIPLSLSRGGFRAAMSEMKRRDRSTMGPNCRWGVRTLYCAVHNSIRSVDRRAVPPPRERRDEALFAIHELPPPRSRCRPAAEPLVSGVALAGWHSHAGGARNAVARPCRTKPSPVNVSRRTHVPGFRGEGLFAG